MNRIMPYLKMLRNARVAVFGDLILDHYIWGKVDRVSPEAPVPVVRVTRENFLAGGSANVALNIKAVNSTVGVCGVVGSDVYGEQVISFLDGNGIDTAGVMVDDERHTTLKTRIIAGHQHVVRVDREEVKTVNAAMVKRVTEFVERNRSKYNVFVISDYAKGFVTKQMVNELRKAAARNKVYLLADPKTQNVGLYKGFYLITPNRKEAVEASKLHRVESDAELTKAGRKLMRGLSLRNLLITRGEEGMSLFSGREHHRIPTFAQEVFDVTGAGDTVISVIAAGLSAGIGLLQCCILANVAASIVVSKIGTATATADEIARKWHDMDADLKRELEKFL